MRTIHVPHIHKPDWHHIREQLVQMVHDPLFWMMVILGLISIGMIFFVTLAPGHPEPFYSPYYPFLG